MNNVTTILNQILHLIPRAQFEQFVKQNNGNRYTKTLNCWQLLICFLYAQAADKSSLREIETSLRVNQNKWYHLGLNSVARSTLSEANNKRSHQIFESLFYEMVKRCKSLAPTKKFDIKNDLYALDSTLISLCLAVFPWAKYGKRKGGFKMHNLYNIKTQIPEIAVITEGGRNDLAVAKEINLSLPPDSILVMDRAYIDFEWLYKLHKDDIFFVHRMKSNINHAVLGQHQPINEKGLIADQIIGLFGNKTMDKYPENLRLVTYYDEKTDKIYKFFTNNFDLSAKTIADIYKHRWEIELFFKWIKQNLKIKTFWGISQNAILVQIWIAMIYYLILAYIKHQTKYSYSMLELTWIFKEKLMSNLNIIDLLQFNSQNISNVQARAAPQLSLF